ncbi:MAG: acylphosphatase [Proteobacteria bacterium]|nr:acylphosphatase [Pseudomonadota bacterium]
MKRYHLFIYGKVQGVWYRQSMLSEAIKLGVKGWVKNLPDGRVEAVIEGDEDALEKIINWCHIGPPNAIVSKVEVFEEQFLNEFASFKVLY